MRQQTKMEKKRLAMAMRKKQLGALGMTVKPRNSVVQLLCFNQLTHIDLRCFRPTKRDRCRWKVRFCRRWTRFQRKQDWLVVFVEKATATNRQKFVIAPLLPNPAHILKKYYRLNPEHKSCFKCVFCFDLRSFRVDLSVDESVMCPLTRIIKNFFNRIF